MKRVFTSCWTCKISSGVVIETDQEVVGGATYGGGREGVTSGISRFCLSETLFERSGNRLDCHTWMPHVACADSIWGHSHFCRLFFINLCWRV